MTNLYDYLLSGAPDEKLAVCSRHEQVTYGELIAMAEAIAAECTLVAAAIAARLRRFEGSLELFLSGMNPATKKPLDGY